MQQAQVAVSPQVDPQAHLLQVQHQHQPRHLLLHLHLLSFTLRCPRLRRRLPLTGVPKKEVLAVEMLQALVEVVVQAHHLHQPLDHHLHHHLPLQALAHLSYMMIKKKRWSTWDHGSVEKRDTAAKGRITIENLTIQSPLSIITRLTLRLRSIITLLNPAPATTSIMRLHSRR
jgi:hypothetical protein